MKRYFNKCVDRPQGRQISNHWGMINHLTSEAHAMNSVQKNFVLKPFFAGMMLSVLLTVAGANAALLIFTDRVDPDPDPLISFGNNKSYSFTHSVIADQDGTAMFWDGTYGYNPFTDTILSASIALLFKDESDDGVPESVALILDAQSFGMQTINTAGVTYSATVSSGWDTLLDDGILEVTLQNAGVTSGPQELRSDFMFMESTLTLTVDRETRVQAQQITEPTTLALVCLILTGFVFNRCKKSGIERL